MKYSNMKATLKYRKYSNISCHYNRGSFNFTKFGKKEAEESILKLNVSKISQRSDIKTKVVKEGTSIFNVDKIS